MKMKMVHLSKPTFTLFLLGTTAAFTTTSTKRPLSQTASCYHSSSSPSSLGVSVVSEFLASQSNATSSSSIQSTFETESPESVGMQDPGIEELLRSNYNDDHQKQTKNKKKKKKSKRKPKRKHNYSELESFLKEIPDLDFYTLHSSAVSNLYLDMPINDIIRAIKRAQNRHDVHDLKTIGAFLMDECDKHWGYGFRGTLLSRLAVAALHTKEADLAMKAIETRRVYERPSIQPFESAGIVRGLLRVGMKDEAWDVLEDELRLPLPGTTLQSQKNQAVIKSRALALSSIASRYFYQGQPEESKQALEKLQELGSFVGESNIEFNDLNMPWVRLEEAALECTKKLNENGNDAFSIDLREFVWNAMVEFPCPDGEDEECSIDSYLLRP